MHIYRHSLNGKRILTGECFACGVHASSEAYKNTSQTHEDSALSQLAASKYGKKIWKINPSGYCLVEAWSFAYKLARGEYEGNYAILLHNTIKELIQNPDVYNLIGSYKDELFSYEAVGDYTKGAIDLLPFALGNVTNIKCTIIQVTDGKECSQTWYQFCHDLSTEYIGPEIKLVFSRLRRHYDVAVDIDFIFENFQVPESNAKGILLILLSKYTYN